MNKRAVALLSGGHLYVDFCAGTLPVLLPIIAQRFNLTYAVIGLVVAASSFVSSLSQPLFGYIADRRPAPWALAAGCLFGGLGYGLAGLAPTFGLVLLAVTIGGLAGTFYHPGGAKALPFVGGNRTATAMSFFGLGGNIGLGLGPLVAAWLVARWGPPGVAAIIIPGLIAAAVLLPFSARLEQRRTGATSGTPKAGAARRNLVGVALLFVVSTLRAWAQNALIAFLPFFGLLWGASADAGNRLVAAFLIGGAVASLATGYLADRIGRRMVLTLTLLLTGPLVWQLSQSQGLMAYLLAALAGAFLISGNPVTVVMGQELLPRHVGLVSGLIMGFAYGLGSLGSTATGQIADQFGLVAALRWTAIVPVVGAVLMLFVTSPRPVPAVAERPLTRAGPRLT